MYADKKAYYRKNPQPSRYRYINDRFLELNNPEILKELLAGGSFPIYFQPKFSFSDRKLAGAEALVRYIDKQQLLVAPPHFIPVLESSHLIYMLDFYVFHSVCNPVSYTHLDVYKRQGQSHYSKQTYDQNQCN